VDPGNIHVYALTEFFYYKVLITNVNINIITLYDSLFFIFYQLDAQILYSNIFITFLYMFRELLCSSSGGQLC